MASRTAKKPVYGRTIDARRTYLGKTLDDIETETNGIIYRTLLHRLEKGVKLPESLTYEQTVHLARALEWTVDKLNGVLGVKVPTVDQVVATSGEVIRVKRIPLAVEDLNLPVWGSEDYMVMQLPKLSQYDETELYGVEIAGHKIIPYASNGDIVVFQRKSKAQPGDIVSARVDDARLIVRRYYGSNSDMLQFWDDDPAAKERVVSAPKGTEIHGVAIGRWLNG